MLPRLNIRTEVLPKLKFNGVGGTQTYLSFHAFGFPSFSKTSIAGRRAMNINLKTDTNLAGIRIPDSKLAREITELVRDTEPGLLFHHSSRVYYWAALAGKRRGLRFDPELLYAGAMFHDMGLTRQHSSADERFEVDGANVARDFLRGHGIAQQDIDTVWTAIALHTTPGIPQHMHPVVALVTAGVEMDVLGINYPEFSDAEREAVVHAHPRTPHFKEDIIQAFYDGIKHKPETTFGNVKADVLADKDASFRRGNFCSVIRASAWRG
jgi:HD domain